MPCQTKIVFVSLLLICSLVGCRTTGKQAPADASLKSSPGDHHTRPGEVSLSSFNQIRQRLYENPWKQGDALPEPQGLSRADLFKHLFLNKGPLVDRSARTLKDQTDERPDGAKIKWLHPKGVCASGTWRINRWNPATGLFAEGTEARAIVRFSSGTTDSKYDPPGKGRIFGLAVKLFPGNDLDRSLKTANIVTLDNYGFERSWRKSIFHQDPDSSKQVYFTNVMPPSSMLGKLLAKFFDRFDKPNFARPVYAVAGVDCKGLPVERPYTPVEVRFIPDMGSHPGMDKIPLDFRHDILQQGPGKIRFKIVLVTRDGKPNPFEWRNWKDMGTPHSHTIGELVLDKPVVSDYCEERLHFHHHPNQQQNARHLEGASKKAYQGSYVYTWPPRGIEDENNRCQ